MRIKITAHAVAWIEQEVETWIAGKVAESRALPAQ